MNRKQNSLMRFSRTERLAQLSEQEIVIEKKKREIQAKIEAQRKEEALKKSDSPKEIKKKPDFSKKLSWNRAEFKKDKDKDNPGDRNKNESVINAFSNDGSFLDQFKKLSKSGFTGSKFDVQSSSTTTVGGGLDKKNYEKEHDEKPIKSKWDQDSIDRNYGIRDQQLFDSNNSAAMRQPLDSNLQLKLPPPGVVQLIPPQVQMSSVAQPALQNSIPGAPPSSVQLPNLQSISNPISKFTTNDIPNNDLSSDSKQGINPQFYYNQPSSSVMFPTASQSISPSLSYMQNFPPPPFVYKENEPLPKIRTESVSLTLKSNSIKKLDQIPNPLGVERSPSPPSIQEKGSILTERKSEGYKQSFADKISISKTFLDAQEESTKISSALYNDEDGEGNGEELKEEHRSLAQLVARCGDDFENSLRKRNENDPALKFLFDKNSKVYQMYRELVEKYRKTFKPSDEEETNKFEKRSRISNSASDGDNSSDEERSTSERSGKRLRRKDSSESDSNSKDSMERNKETENLANKKYNDGYQADNEEELPYYTIPESTSKDDCGLFSQKQNAGTVEESNEQSNKEKRGKRKRKSRWGDAVASSSAWQVSAGDDFQLQPVEKLPVPKTTLLSKLTRSDPGLIQYAKQTFGSTNLSEEDWKKAEDHYKINLLYQDMVKKRAEIDKLEKAGKFKYEYDSDEDVEGGTWEHKLRQQEMMATQLWAEELTRQAAGKHHIGDFLPPEELKRFMERYNAVKEGREPDLSDYKEFKLKEDNVGYRLLQKMGWNEGQGLGQDGTGITNPVNKAVTRHENQGLGVERPDGLEAGDDEYDAYRKRMMLAYRFRPNPLNNPRRPYY